MRIDRSVLPRAFRARGLLLPLLLAAAAGCDVATDPPSDFTLAAHASLSVVSSTVEDGRHAAHSAIRVEFDRPLAPESVGARSVRIDRGRGARVRRVRAWAIGSTLFVSPGPGREFPTNADLTLRLEGGGSPRSLRAVDGSALSERHEIGFRTLRRRRLDLVGPRLVGSIPESGSLDVAPGASVQLAFDEPLSRAALRRGDGVVLFVDGQPRPVRTRLSLDLMRVVVRPQQPLPPGVDVVVEVRRGLVDLAGNTASAARVEFSTRATRLHEIDEDFVTTDSSDRAGTSGGWGAASAPGFLVAQAGRMVWSPSDGDEWDAAIPESESLRFQVVFPGGSAPRGAASAVRLTLLGAHPGDTVGAASVDAGPTRLFRADPSFDANRFASEIGPVVRVAEPLDVDVDLDGIATVEIPFDVPVPVRPGGSLLIDVSLRLPPGVQLAATHDTEGLALIQESGDELLPAAELLVSGGPPQARSRWYDSGVKRPGWREAHVVGSRLADGTGYTVEFQTAASTRTDRPDVDRASEWSESLAALPSLRFVRFRVRFDGLGSPGNAPRIDQIALPYQE